MSSSTTSSRRLVCFDLDGTLTDPKIGITRCIQHALERLGFDAPSADDLEWCIGPPLQASMAELVGGERAATAVTYYRERFDEVGWSENVPYEGIHEALTALRREDLTLCVATSKPHVYANRILAHFELAPYFDRVFGAELDGTRSDKSELLAHALASASHAGPASMIGDRHHDVVGALANGMEAIGVTYGYGGRTELAAAGAHHIIDTPSVLGALFAGSEG